MRTLAVLALLALVRLPARADEAPPAVAHPAIWYASWSLIAAGGAAALTGVALTPQDSTTARDIGWTMAGVGTVMWIAGAVILKATDLRPPSTKRAALAPLRF